MKSTLKVYYYTMKTTSTEKDGKHLIICRLSMKGHDNVTFSTQSRVHPDKWNKITNRCIGKTKDEIKINRVLDDLAYAVIDKANEMDRHRLPVSPHSIKESLFAPVEKQMMMIELFDHHNEEYGKKVPEYVSKGHFQKYIRTRNRLAEFIKEQFKTNDIPLAHITPDFIKKYYNWEMVTFKNDINTLQKSIQRFHAAYSVAIDKEWVTKDPFEKVHCPTKESDRQPLTMNEVLIIMQTVMKNQRLEKIRKAFLFACFTGLAYADVHKLTPNEIKMGDDGKWWIMTGRDKNGNAVFVPMLDVAVEIMLEFKSRWEKTGKVIPLATNQKVNDYLKEIAAICGIDRDITFHVARHTFATTITLENGIPIESLQKMLGHRKLQTTQIYGKVTKSKLAREMDVLENTIGQIIQQPAITSSPIL